VDDYLLPLTRNGAPVMLPTDVDVICPVPDPLTFSQPLRHQRIVQAGTINMALSIARIIRALMALTGSI